MEFNVCYYTACLELNQIFDYVEYLVTESFFSPFSLVFLFLLNVNQ